MASYLAFLSLGLAGLASFAHTYGIDSSCDDVDLIQQSADAAITMAHGALNELNKAPLDPNVNRLLDLLFRPSDGASAPTDDTIIAQMKDVYEGVSLFQGKTDFVRPSDREATEDQVNIFCNLDRVKKRSNDNQWVDSATGIILKDFTDKDVKECTTLSGTLAFTWSPERARALASGSLSADYTYSPSQVTLCPWFYHFARFKALKHWRDLRPKAALAAAAVPLTTGGWPFTPIDAINLLDKVLLHEFTHTVACGRLEDVPMAEDGAPGFGVGYGWKAATALAKQEDNDPLSDDEGTGKSPLRNSDSLALFASGSFDRHRLRARAQS